MLPHVPSFFKDRKRERKHSGDYLPLIRFRHEAMPVPVPLLGAGKISGVLYASQSFTRHGYREKTH